MRPSADVIVGTVRPTLLVLLGGAGLLLVIASVNVVGLLLVRSESRKREIAVRSAMGASSARLLAQFVTEGVVLARWRAALSGSWPRNGPCGSSPASFPRACSTSMPFLHGLGLNLRVLCLRRGADRAARGGAVLDHSRAAPVVARDSRRPRRGQPRLGGHDLATPRLQARGRWSWPWPWCCWSARGFWARASTGCSRWISDCSPSTSSPCSSPRPPPTTARTSRRSPLAREIESAHHGLARRAGRRPRGQRPAPRRQRQHHLVPGPGPALARRAQRIVPSAT